MSKGLVCGGFAFLAMIMVLTGMWAGGSAVWVTAVGINFTARFLVSAGIGVLIGYWVS